MAKGSSQPGSPITLTNNEDRPPYWLKLGTQSLFSNEYWDLESLKKNPEVYTMNVYPGKPKKFFFATSSDIRSMGWAFKNHFHYLHKSNGGKIVSKVVIKN